MKCYDQNSLMNFIKAVLSAAGSDAAEAEIVARHLVEANLTGHDSHGIGMLPTYVSSIEKGAPG